MLIVLSNSLEELSYYMLSCSENVCTLSMFMGIFQRRSSNFFMHFLFHVFFLVCYFCFQLVV